MMYWMYWEGSGEPQLLGFMQMLSDGLKHFLIMLNKISHPSPSTHLTLLHWAQVLLIS